MTKPNRTPLPHLARLTTGLVFVGLACIGAVGCGGSESGTASEDVAAPETIVTETGAEMVLIPGGWFEMGSDDGNQDEGPVHRVWVDPFLMDKYEVTQDQYAQLQLSDPSGFSGDRLPVEQQTWIDAVRFCNERSIQEGLDPCYDEGTLECDFDANGYRLPTEAEWEYASRAGSTTAYSWGNDLRLMSQHAWTAENSGQRTHEVGTRRPNQWGLFDMSGNVAEWVNDYYGESYYRSSPERNPRGPDDGEFRVLRGGAWDSSAEAILPTRRSFSASVDDGCLVTDTVGFRCVRRPLPSEAAAGSGSERR